MSKYTLAIKVLCTFQFDEVYLTVLICLQMLQNSTVLYEIERWPLLRGHMLPPLKGVVVKKGVARFPT